MLWLIALIPIFAIVAFGIRVLADQPSQKLTPDPVYADADQMFSLVQEWRKNNGLTEYSTSALSCQIAQTRLDEVKDNFSHDGFDANRFCTTNCLLGENLADNLLKIDNPTTLDLWTKSPLHLAELQKNYPYSCIKTDGRYIVQIFSNL
jgi:uncharacterized protein YkwD